MQANVQSKDRQNSDEPTIKQPQAPIAEQDDRYPGSFFRIPGVPLPGKTTWSLAK